MNMAKKNELSDLDKINELLGISESYMAPERMMQILQPGEKDKVFNKFLEMFDCDVTYDWFHKYFQDDHADRKTKKQDFTPNSISLLVAEILNPEGVLWEPAAGTGGMIIKAWETHRKKTDPFSYDPSSLFVVAEEMSDRTIPFLLFNLSIRGINGNVVHCNSLDRKCKEVYHLHNVRNFHLDFSEIVPLPHNAAVEQMFNVIFET